MIYSFASILVIHSSKSVDWIVQRSTMKKAKLSGKKMLPKKSQFKKMPTLQFLLDGF
jgi:ribosome-binding factor A